MRDVNGLRLSELNNIRNRLLYEWNNLILLRQNQYKGIHKTPIYKSFIKKKIEGNFSEAIASLVSMVVTALVAVIVWQLDL